MKLVIANLKTNLSPDASKDWIDTFARSYSPQTDINVVIAPEATQLEYFSKITKNLESVFLASQDVSVFPAGSYTGELPASHLRQFCQYSLVGHSERRKMDFAGERFHEEPANLITQKVRNCLDAHLIPIICFSQISEIENVDHDQQIYLAYEPIAAIGSGRNTDIDAINEIYQGVAKIYPRGIIYGGSVDENNLPQYFSQDFINGVIVGSAAISVDQFLRVLETSNKIDLSGQ